LRDLMQMTVTFSDNTAADMLLRLAGSPKVVNHYMASLGVTGFHLRDDERALHRKHDLQYRNWFEPRGAVQLLRRISDHSPLTAEHTALLLEWMSLPSGRLEANLPSGTRVFHKSGSSDVDEGIAGATNDIGLIALPDGRQLAIAVFVTDSRADSATRLQVIARMVTCLGDSFVSPVSLVIFHRREGSALHVIDVHGALQVIDLMLQDARVPARRNNHAFASVLIETLDRDFASTRDHSHEARQTQAAFEEFDFLIPEGRNAWIDDDVERNRPALADGKILLRYFPHVLGEVFNDRELDSFTNLRRSESYAGRSVESLAH
jgi:hypothetical protein